MLRVKSGCWMRLGGWQPFIAILPGVTLMIDAQQPTGDEAPDYDATNPELVAFEAGFRCGAWAELSFHLRQVEKTYTSIPEHLRPMVKTALDAIDMGDMLPGQNNMQAGYAACNGDEWGRHYAEWLAEKGGKR